MMALSHPHYQHHYRCRRHNYDRAVTRLVTGIRMVAFFLATIVTQNTIDGFALQTLSPPPPPTAASITRRPVSTSSSSSSSSTAVSSTSRRDFWEHGGTASMTAAAATAAVVAVVGPVPPVAAAATSPGILENRLRSSVLEAPSFGMEGTDIFYPA